MDQLKMNTYAVGDHVRIYQRCSWTKTTDKTSWYDAIVDEIDWRWEHLYSGAHIYAHVTAVVNRGKAIPHSGCIGKRTDFFSREDRHVSRLTSVVGDAASLLDVVKKTRVEWTTGEGFTPHPPRA